MSLLDDLCAVENAQDTDLKKEIYHEVISTLAPYMNDLLQQVHHCKAEIDILRVELNSRMVNKADKTELDYWIHRIRGYSCY
jgi:hypothetical protein